MAHILIVDDGVHIRTMLAEYVENLGHSVALAEDGLEALKYLAGHETDIMILDIIMPEQDGIGAILEIMKLSKRPAIIAISGGSRNFDADFVENLVKLFPIASFLQKPINLDDIGYAIDKALTFGCK